MKYTTADDRVSIEKIFFFLILGTRLISMFGPTLSEHLSDSAKFFLRHKRS